MSRTVEELVKIKDLPGFLRTEHCFNDMQHAMLVILFRHALVALGKKDARYAGQLIDNISLYLCIHFLNEEEGMVFNMGRDLITRDGLAEHSETHIRFLDIWKEWVFNPFKTEELSLEQVRVSMVKYYNLIIKHIDEIDQHVYGVRAPLTDAQVRTELAHVAKSNMPMSPFMVGAYDTVKALDADMAAKLNKKYLSPIALLPIRPLKLIGNVGRVLGGPRGSLRDSLAHGSNVSRNTRKDPLSLFLAA